MDMATADTEGNPEQPGSGRPPSIGVRSIPTQGAPVRPPLAVPSVPVPTAPVEEGSGPVVAEDGPLVPDRTADHPGSARLAPASTRWSAAAVDTRGDTTPTTNTGATTSGVSDRAANPATATGSPTPERSVGVEPFGLAFPPGVAARLGWYVYLLAEPGSDRPCFVGRGRGDRCFDHVRAARVEPASTGQDRRAKKFPALDLIRRIEAAEGPVRVEILRYGLSADEARLVAAAVTDALGLPADAKRGGRRQAAAELGTQLAKRAKFKREHPLVLLHVGVAATDTDYGTVRHGWRIGRRWTDPSVPRSPQWAVIVIGELVVGVYRIERWEPTPLPGRADRRGPQDRRGRGGRPAGPVTGPAPVTESESGATTVRSTYRHSFIGERDDQLEDRYLGRSVAAYLGARARPTAGAGVPVGAPNQVTYVGCGPNAMPPAS